MADEPGVIPVSIPSILSINKTGRPNHAPRRQRRRFKRGYSPPPMPQQRKETSVNDKVGF